MIEENFSGGAGFFDRDEEESRVLSRVETPEDREAEPTLRPRRFEDYIGQTKVKENLKIYIEAAKQRGDALDHVLLYGPPGLGKTTLAGIIAAEMGSNLRITSGPAIEKTGDLAALLTSLSDGDILFIDEIHRLQRSVEEILYPAMEDGSLDIIIGKGPAARSIREKRITVKAGDEVRCMDGDGVRGQGEVYTVKSTNYFNYSELWM